MIDIRFARDEEFDKVFSVLKTSFPPDERRTYDAQKALLSNPKYNIYVLPDSESDEIKAFITVWQFGTFAFVEHFAVNPKYRNLGLGSAILNAVVGLLPCRICLEVELPETDTAKRRIEFYKRNGFFTNDYQYIQPPYGKDKQPVPLILMTHGSSIAEKEFENTKKTIFKEVYNDKAL